MRRDETQPPADAAPPRVPTFARFIELANRYAKSPDAITPAEWREYAAGYEVYARPPKPRGAA